MASINPPPIGSVWTLIYDTAVSGDFTGLVSITNGENCVLRVSDTEPLAADPGFNLTPHQEVSIASIRSEKLWGKSAGGDCRVQLDTTMAPSALPVEVFESSRAMTVQTYQEGNVKEGVEYEVSKKLAALASGASMDIIISIGSDPMTINNINLAFDGTDNDLTFFESPVFTGGTPLTVYNRTTRNPVTGQIALTQTPTVTDPGTQVSTPFYYLGDGSGGAFGGGVTGLTSSQYRLLKANTTYLLRIENTGASAERIALYMQWYEGQTDLPRP